MSDADDDGPWTIDPETMAVICEWLTERQAAHREPQGDMTAFRRKLDTRAQEITAKINASGLLPDGYSLAWEWKHGEPEPGADPF